MSDEGTEVAAGKNGGCGAGVNAGGFSFLPSAPRCLDHRQPSARKATDSVFLNRERGIAVKLLHEASLAFEHDSVPLPKNEVPILPLSALPIRRLLWTAEYIAASHKK